MLTLLTILLITLKTGAESKDERKFLDYWSKEVGKSDRLNTAYRRETRLYSRNSGKHLRILPNKKVDANGSDQDQEAKIIIESDNFGRVQFKGISSGLYLCVDQRGRLRGRVRGFKKKNCIFKEKFTANHWSEFESVEYKKLFVAFNRKGKPRNHLKVHSGMQAVQFLHRPYNPTYYIGRRLRRRQMKLRRERRRRRQKQLGKSSSKKRKVERKNFTPRVIFSST